MMATPVPKLPLFDQTANCSTRFSVRPMPTSTMRTPLRLRLGAKLGLAFTGVLAVMLASLVIVLHKSAQASDAYERAIAWKTAVEGAANQAAGTRQQQSAQALYVATGELRYKREWQAGVDASEKAGASVEALHDPVVSKLAAGATTADHNHDDTVHKLLFPAMARGDSVAAHAALLLADKYVRVPLQAQEQIGAYVRKRQSDDVTAARSATNAARTAGWIAGLLATLLAAAIVFLVSRGIRRSAGQVLDRLNLLERNDAADLQEGLNAVASGDLTRFVSADTPAIAAPGFDEIGDIGRATNGIRDSLHASVESYNGMRGRLSELIGEVAGSSNSVAAASRQMATTSQEAGAAVGEIANAVGEVASGAERQARSVEAVREIASEAAEVARESVIRAREAARAADAARGVARAGAVTAQEAFDAMTGVQASSKDVTAAIQDLAVRSSEIESIVETIAALAAQTNLLALNAAIEAARAGEQGRGFAVVAEEVRKLAEGSQAAAGSIAELIAQIQQETARVVGVVESGAERTEAGARTVAQARDAFADIEAAVVDVTTRVEDIADAVERISDGTGRIQADVGEVAAVAEQSSASAEQVTATTQETSASTHEIAASAEELAATASRLDGLVGSFRF
jgi:methyl-accepting chemotaxis protein